MTASFARDGKLFAIIDGEVEQIGVIRDVTCFLPDPDGMGPPIPVSVAMPEVQVELVARIAVRKVVNTMLNKLLHGDPSLGRPNGLLHDMAQQTARREGRATGGVLRRPGSVSGKGQKRAHRWARW